MFEAHWGKEADVEASDAEVTERAAGYAVENGQLAQPLPLK